MRIVLHLYQAHTVKNKHRIGQQLINHAIHLFNIYWLYASRKIIVYNNGDVRNIEIILISNKNT